MALASVQPEQPWAGRDDQAVARETAETVSQEGKRLLVRGMDRVALEADLTFGSHQGTELAREGQREGKVTLWQNEIPSYQGERCPGGRVWVLPRWEEVVAGCKALGSTADSCIRF